MIPHVLSLAKRHEGECILLATHATVVRAFECYARGYHAEDTGKIPFYHNASINIYTCEENRVTPVETDIIEHLEKDGLATTLPKTINA